MPIHVVFLLRFERKLYYAQKNFVLSAQAFSGETVMIPEENNAGFVVLVGALLADEVGAIRPPGAPKSRNGLGAGLLKVTRPDSWRTKATIAVENSIV